MFETEAGPESLVALDAACRALAKKGVKIVERALPDSFRSVLESHHAVLAAEAVVIHEAGYAQRRMLFPPKIAELIQEGQKTLAAEYVKAIRHRREVIADLSALLEDVDAAITPSTVAPAPTPETTGPRVFQGPWSYVGFPTITVPVTLAEGRLPLGVQWISGTGTDDKLFRHAAAYEALLPFTEMPD